MLIMIGVFIGLCLPLPSEVWWCWGRAVLPWQGVS